MRIEGNISLRPMGSSGFGTKVEVKNLNSFRSLEHAMEFEVVRHAEALERGESLRPGDARLGRDRWAHRQPAEQGRGERLPILPRAGPAAAAPVARLDCRDPRSDAGAAGRASRAIRAGARAVRVRRRCADRQRGAIGVLRPGRVGGHCAEVGRQLGDRRVQPAAEPACRRWAPRVGRRADAARAGRADRRGGRWPRVRHQRQGGAGHRLCQRRVAAGRDRARGAGAGARHRSRSNGKWRPCSPSSRSRWRSIAAASSRSTVSWWGRS